VARVQGKKWSYSFGPSQSNDNACRRRGIKFKNVYMQIMPRINQPYISMQKMRMYNESKNKATGSQVPIGQMVNYLFDI